jgi:hypothetical protein
MSPDIEWRIGESADEETSVRVNPPAARWRAAVVMVVVSSGIALGMLYMSIPEPMPRPTALRPTSSPPTSISMPARDTRDVTRFAAPLADDYTRFNLLRDAIDQEVTALAEGDEAAFSALQDQTDQDWLNTQRQDFHAWGRPSTPEAPPGSLYFYSRIPSSPTPEQDAWIDISQYRAGRMFRETRFYRWQIGRWVRVRPPLDFWNGAAIEILTPRFRARLPQVDQALAADLMRQLEFTYQQICFDLACPDGVLTPTQPLRVLVSPTLARGQSWFTLDDPPTLHIPSPRISGLQETTTALTWDDPVMPLLYLRLSEIIARAISGGHARWSANSNGALYLIAVAQWELWRGQHGIDLDTYIGIALLRGRPITSPKYLWDWPVRDGRRLASPQAQTNSVIAFIDRSFGAERVVHFLRTLHTARSLPQAIEATLPISYTDFEQQWQTWLETRLSE